MQAEKREKMLHSKLAGVRGAREWRVTLVDSQGIRPSYRYFHREFGTFNGMTSAKNAHLLAAVNSRVKRSRDDDISEEAKRTALLAMIDPQDPTARLWRVDKTPGLQTYVYTHPRGGQHRSLKDAVAAHKRYRDQDDDDDDSRDDDYEPRRRKLIGDIVSSRGYIVSSRGDVKRSALLGMLDDDDETIKLWRVEKIPGKQRYVYMHPTHGEHKSLIGAVEAHLNIKDDSRVEDDDDDDPRVEDDEDDSRVQDEDDDPRVQDESRQWIDIKDPSISKIFQGLLEDTFRSREDIIGDIARSQTQELMSELEERTMFSDEKKLSRGRLTDHAFLLKAGSPAALDCIRRGKWQNVETHEPAIGNISIDVVLVDFTESLKEVPTQDWCMSSLISKHGFLRVTRPAVVIDAKTSVIAGMFLTDRFVEVRRATELLDSVKEFLFEYMPDANLRKGIRMYGHREYRYGKKGTNPMGPYRAKDDAIWQKIKRLREVDKTARMQYLIELLAAPAMAAQRMKHARDTRSPGLTRGLSDTRLSPATAFGISRNYGNKKKETRLHRDGIMVNHIDDKDKGVSLENIVWLGAKPSESKEKSACFALGCRVLFDLTVAESTCALVQGRLYHGTPMLDSKSQNPDRPRIGAVIINKAINVKTARKGYKKLSKDPRGKVIVRA